MKEKQVLLKENSFYRYKKNIKSFLSEFSKGILVPVFTLPIIGLLLAVGILFTNPSLPLSNITILKNLGTIITKSLLSIFINLSPIFCVGIAAGMAKSKKGVAALNSLILFFVFLYSMNSFLGIKELLVDGNLRGTGQANILGIQVLDMGVFLGMVVGILTAVLHNYFIDKEFSGTMRMYGGANLGLFIGIPLIILLSVFFSYTWPAIQGGIHKITTVIMATGVFGVGLYGFLERILIPTGLHHLLWVPIEFSSISGAAVVDGKTLEGVRNIAMAELTSPNIKHLSHGAVYLTKAMSKMFGLVGAALAIYKCSDKENKAKVKSILIPAVIASVFAGITEPLEFSFLFLAPVLFLVHSLLTGLGMAIVALFDIRVIAVSGGIEFLAMMLPAGSKADTLKFVIVGLGELIVYYFIFKFLIEKFNLKTPGRNSNDNLKLHLREEYNESKTLSKDQRNEGTAELIIEGLGGKENIADLTNCFSRLRVKVKDMNKIDMAILEKTNHSGTVIQEYGIQIIYGLQVQKIKNVVDKKLGIKLD